MKTHQNFAWLLAVSLVNVQSSQDKLTRLELILGLSWVNASVQLDVTYQS